MPYKLSEKQRRFAQGVASGLSQTEAYIKAGYASKSAHNNAHRLMENDGIKAYLQELQQKADDEAIMDVTEWQKLMTSAARGKEKDEQVFYVDGTPEKIETRIRWNERLKAADMLAKARGYYTPDTNNDDIEHFKRIMDAVKEAAEPHKKNE